jgi:hypothetical protein
MTNVTANELRALIGAVGWNLILKGRKVLLRYKGVPSWAYKVEEGWYRIEPIDVVEP